MNSSFTTVPEFIDSTTGRLFVCSFVPAKAIDLQHCVIIVPPFAEEMNRCRRMMSEQARLLASNGFRSIVFDFYGTGDSAGDFVDASWELWRTNLAEVTHYCRSNGNSKYSILAVRLGALIALDGKSDTAAAAQSIVLWSPCVSGKNYLRQFIRLRLASQLASNGAPNETQASILDEFKAGKSVEIGGYDVSANLALAIDGAEFDVAGKPALPPVHWFDVVTAENAPVGVASKNCAERLRQTAVDVRLEAVQGEQFWATVETTMAPKLLSATLESLRND